MDGANAWGEFDWIGHDIRIGGAVFDLKNGRCGATNVNPATGRRDLDIPGSLRAAFGPKNLGIYLLAREGGRISVGDELYYAPIDLRQRQVAARSATRRRARDGRVGDTPATAVRFSVTTGNPSTGFRPMEGTLAGPEP